MDKNNEDWRFCVDVGILSLVKRLSSWREVELTELTSYVVQYTY